MRLLSPRATATKVCAQQRRERLHAHTRSYKSGGARHGGRAFFFSSSWVYGLVVVRFNRCGLGFVQHFGENGVRLGERVRAGLLGWRSGL